MNVYIYLFILLTSSEAGFGEATAGAPGLLDVVGASATSSADGVRLVLHLTERLRSLRLCTSQRRSCQVATVCKSHTHTQRDRQASRHTKSTHTILAGEERSDSRTMSVGEPVPARDVWWRSVILALACLSVSVCVCLSVFDLLCQHLAGWFEEGKRMGRLH